jgi:putative spermidine/putrescine transport system permease protein
MTRSRDRLALICFAAPATILLAAFFLLPMAHLIAVGASGKAGIGTYWLALTGKSYLWSLAQTVIVSTATTIITLILSGVVGLFLQRHRFPGRATLTAILTFPLAFPGVVVGFMVIMLAGRQGLIGEATQWLTGDKLVFAYSIGGLLLGYIYFSIPRTFLTVMAAAEKLDPKLEEAARSLGAGSWRITRDVLIPGLKPALISSGAICFATAMGAFGTAFTLATRIDVLPMAIYTEFTLQANMAMAAALSLILGIITWAVLALARTAAGSSVAAGA